MPTEDERLHPARWIWPVVLAAASLALGASGVGYYHAEMETVREEAFRTVTAIAELKSAEIARWRKDRLTDVQREAGSPFVRRAVEQWLRALDAPGPRDECREWLRTLTRTAGFDDARLAAADGSTLLTARDGAEEASRSVQRAIDTAFQTRQPVLSDLHRDDEGVVCIDAAAPLLDAAGRPMATLVLRSNAETYLFPLIQAWPTPSPTGEALLVTRDGNEVLYLNELRHRRGTALTLRFPIDRKGLPAAEAAGGRTGRFRGTDYRGELVLANLRSIPGSPWSIVTKLDEREVLVEARARAIPIAIAGAALVLAIGGLIVLGQRRRQASLYRRLYEGERAKREAQSEIERLEADQRAVLDHLPVGIAVSSIEPGGSFRYMNDNFPAFYRTTREKLRDPDAFWDAVYEDPEFRDAMRTRVLEDCASRDPRRMLWPDVPIERKGAETAYVTARIIDLPDRGLSISVVWDVTEHKRTEAEREQLEAQLRQAQKMESVGRLAGGVAHDFNNMLTVILGHSELVLNRLPASDPLRQDIHEVLAAARRSTELTKQLLAFARQQAIQPKLLDLNRTVEDMLRMLRRLIGEEIDLIWRPGDNLRPVLMDPAQLDLILANLTVNARDAISGAGRVTIETRMAAPGEHGLSHVSDAIPGPYVLLSVSDNGCGMSAEDEAHLFEPFFTTKPSGQGTGLGLATVYGIVKQNRGLITVKTQLGRGTTITIFLRGEEAQVATEGRTPAPTEPMRGCETVLLVEDEGSLLALTKRMLEMLGYTVLATSRPTSALDTIREYQGDIHLLLTDVVMPEVSGRELQQRLSAVRPGIKCVFMSGYTADAIARQGVLDPDIHFLQKPFTLETLAAKLRAALASP